MNTWKDDNVLEKLKESGSDISEAVNHLKWYDIILAFEKPNFKSFEEAENCPVRMSIWKINRKAPDNYLQRHGYTYDADGNRVAKYIYMYDCCCGALYEYDMYENTWKRYKDPIEASRDLYDIFTLDDFVKVFSEEHDYGYYPIKNMDELKAKFKDLKKELSSAFKDLK